MTQKEFSSLGLQPETDVVLTLLDGTRKYVRYTGLRLINALDPDSNRQIEPCFVEAPGRTFSMPLKDIDDIEMPPLSKRIVARLQKALDGDKPGDTVRVMDAAEDPHGLETGAKIYQIDNVPIFYNKKALVRVIRAVSENCRIAIPKGLHPIEHKPTIYESPEEAKFDKNGFEGYAPS